MGDTTSAEMTPSGRFLLRTGPVLHAALREAARRAGVSLNEYCLSRLGAPVPVLRPDASAAIGWARQAFSATLVGIAVYGSWARGEASAESDVDLLIVLDPAQPLTRDLYRRCDAVNLTWEGYPVQTQVVHLPAAGEVGGGLWPEIALDGIVLDERDYALSLRLVKIRRAIAEGRIVRRTSHGQPYWTAS